MEHNAATYTRGGEVREIERMGEGTTGVAPVVARVCDVRALDARTSEREGLRSPGSPSLMSMLSSSASNPVRDGLRANMSITAPLAASARLLLPTPMR